MTEDPFSDLHRVVVELWQSAPAPRELPFGDGSRPYWATAATTAIAWGWLVRVIRTGEAAIQLERSGYADEAAPLMRSIIEHTIRLAYAADAGVEVFEIALRERTRSLERLKKAQSPGWSLTAEQLSEIGEMQAEASDEFRHLDSLAHLTNVVARYPSFKQLYMAWILETQVCHPTLVSAQSYFERDDESRDYGLRTWAKESSDSTSAQACLNLLIALEAYASIAGLTSHYKEHLEHLNARMSTLWRERNPE